MVTPAQRPAEGSQAYAGRFYQRREGNIKEPFFQPKLTVGPVDDVYEREADQVADAVMRMGDGEVLQRRISPVSVQRKCAACEEEEQLQRKEERAVQHSDGAPDVVHRALREPGSAMDSGTQSFMETRMGYDFGRVKIHTGTTASQSAQTIQARAYTHGNDIVFNEGQYAPGTDQGRELLAHELTHTVQQTGGVSKDTVQRQVPPAAPVFGAACSGGANDPCQRGRCGDRGDGINGDFLRAINYATAAAAALGESSLSERTIQALDWYFNDHSAGTAATVRERMLCINSCLTDAFIRDEYGCHPVHGSALAYVCVGATPVCTDHVTNICLTDSYFGKSDRVRAEVLIHECSHRIGLSLGGPNFDIYDHQEHFLRLSTAETLMNADSFALFAGAITNGVRATLVLNPVFPLGLGLSGGVALSGGSPTWFARWNYVNLEMQHPVVGIFNPALGLSVTLIGESSTGSGSPVTASTSGLISLTAGIRIGDARPGPDGGGYFSLWGGPSLAIGSTIGLGAEAGVALGYRWRWLDVSAGGTYFHDPTRPEGLRDILTLGPTISISFMPTFVSVPGSH